MKIFAAIVIGYLLNVFVSYVTGIEPAKNMAWTMMWVYFSIEAWKYWKWKALLPYPCFVLVAAVLGASGFSLMAVVLNICGLAAFSWLPKAQAKKQTPNHEQNTTAETESVSESDIYQTINEEMARKDYNKELAAKAFAEAKSDKAAAKNLYIQFRYEELFAQRELEHKEKQRQQTELELVKKQRQEKLMQQLYEAALGEKNRIYYLKKFQQFDQQEQIFKASWNWSAFLFTFLFFSAWAIYRKMYGWFFICLGIGIVSIVFQKNFTLLFLLFPFLLSIAFAIFADSLYYQSIKKKIANAQITIKDDSDLIEFTSNKGGVNRQIVWVFSFLALSPVIGMIWYLLVLVRDAEQGNIVSQNNLGVLYSRGIFGIGIAQDEIQAVKWYRKAAEQGDDHGQFNLGLMYAKGEGIAKDEAQAIFWLRKAANQGNTEAQATLKLMQGPQEVVTNTNEIRTQGSLIYPNGNKYLGEIKNGKPDGQGILTFPNGVKYVGEWKSGEPNGQGLITTANGEKYEGEFKNSKYEGKGTFTYADGARYVGEFKNNEFNGQGVLTAVGYKYVGEFKNGKSEGQGKATYSNGSSYEGQFKNGLPNGAGIGVYADGSYYSGQWKDGHKLEIEQVVRVSKGTASVLDTSGLRQQMAEDEEKARNDKILQEQHRLDSVRADLIRKATQNKDTFEEKRQQKAALRALEAMPAQ